MIRNLLISGALTVAAAVELAAPAQADELDFISALDKNGIYYSSINDMIDVGKQACHGMRAHMDGRIVSAEVASAGGYTQQEVAIILTQAANYMCPDVWPWINSLAKPQPPP